MTTLGLPPPRVLKLIIGRTILELLLLALVLFVALLDVLVGLGSLMPLVSLLQVLVSPAHRPRLWITRNLSLKVSNM